MPDSRRIVITRPLPADPVGLLATAGFDDVWINPTDVRMGRDDLLHRIRGAAGILVTPADMQVDGAFFDAAGDGLQVVSAYAVGVDNIDVAEANRRGIRVGHTPGAVTEPTADAAWLLILAAARRAREGLDLIRAGEWTGVKPLDPMGRRLVGKTLFIVGAGRIGYATARRSIGWDMTVLYHARSHHPEFEAAPINARRVSLEEGLEQADVVSLHTPLTDETHHLIGAAEIERMKPTAVLVNTARGPIVDEEALIAALEAGRLFGAGLDVFEREPVVPDRLAALPNAHLLPHWGSATDEDRAWMTEIAVDNITTALRGEALRHEFRA
ncbi:MAG: 2-hydroxyacid dehydrogenase [Planctomycetota bacterium]|jgi:lactate dehydrogenase-like 2-hydroxyacid dehydrogenase